MESKIIVKAGSLKIPDYPVIPFIEGDGIGPEIWQATRMVVDNAVKKVYGGKRKISWKEILAGEKAYKETGNWLPQETLEAIKDHVIAIKGPLTTPVGGGFRSLNVTIRQTLDLYACVRPIKWIKGISSPVKHPEWVDMVIFRENTEDIYAGLEWPAGSREMLMLRDFLNEKLGADIPEDAGLGIKPISKRATERIVKKALEYAIQNDRKTVTIVHKGNIMKYTEGSFKIWGYEIARREFGDIVINEEELVKYSSGLPEGKIKLNDRIADNMLQQVLLNPREYEVLVMPNLNGDYLSDAVCAQVGGLGMAPGANIGDYMAIFEATHGSAPDIAGQGKANPGSLILSAIMMLKYMNWHDAARLIYSSFEKTIVEKKVTCDLARQINGAKELTTLEFAEEVISNMYI